MLEATGRQVPHGDDPIDCLSIRELFAAQAMQGLLAGEADLGCGPFASRQQWREKVASEAVALADALLARLAENGGDKQRVE